MKHSDLINIEMLREQRQQTNDEAVENLYDRYLLYLNRHTNIREKVRARHIFCNTVGIEPSELLLDSWNDHFEHWFAFDYRNIRGAGMFDLFLRERNGELTEPLLKVSAFFLIAALEPVIVTKRYNKDLLEVKGIVTNHCEQVKSMKIPFHHVHNNDLLLMRKVRSGFRMITIGPYLKINHDKANMAIEKVERDFKNFQNQFPKTAFRTFLKTHGLQYLNL